ncbi:hypothetical protein GYB14_19160 [bacterium]|nr:hypothetical protein [bacterium]
MKDAEEWFGGFTVPKKVRRNTGGLMTIADLAEVVTPPGKDKAKVADQLRWYLRQGYLTPVAQEEEGRKAFLFLPDQALVAEVLFRMTEFGIADTEAGLAANHAFNVWREDDLPEGQPPHHSPGIMVIRDYEAGHRDWSFELWCFIEVTTGQKRFHARLAANQRRIGTSLRWGKENGHDPRAVFAVDLVDVLDRIHPRNRKKREGMN